MEDEKILEHDAKISMGNYSKLLLKIGDLRRKRVEYKQLLLTKMYRRLVYEELHEKMSYLGVDRVI